MTTLPQDCFASREGWLSADQLRAETVGDRLLGWLLWEEPLVERLQAASGQPVTIANRRESVRPLTTAECALMGSSPGSVWQRTTTVAVEGRAYIHATSLTPVRLLDTHDFLRSLGDAPLGATLKERAQFQREGLQFRRSEDEPSDWERLSELVLAPGRIYLFERFTREFERWPAP